jgi:hypothetical protein
VSENPPPRRGQDVGGEPFERRAGVEQERVRYQSGTTSTVVGKIKRPLVGSVDNSGRGTHNMARRVLLHAT